MADPYKIGQTVELNDGRTGTVQHVDPTSFSAGDWIGIVLEEPTGKNDGSVQGQRYFECDPGHGMFLRASGVSKVLQEPAPKAAARPRPSVSMAGDKPKTTSTTATATRQARPGSVVSNGVRKSTLTDPTASKRQSINAASPTPAARTTTTNGVKSPAKPRVGSAATSTAPATTRGTTPSLASKRTSTIGAPKPVSTTRSTATSSTATSRPSTTAASTSTATRTSRLSSAGTSATRGARTSTTAPARPAPATAPPRTSRLSNATAARQAIGATRSQVPPARPAQKDTNAQIEQEEDQGDEADQNEDEEQVDAATSGMNGNFAPPKPQVKEKAPDPPESPVEDPSEHDTPPTPGKTQLSASTTRHMQDLEAKLRVLEKRREDDKEKLLSLEKMQSEKERLESIIQKMQNKLQPQAQELSELRKQLKESHSKLEDNEKHHADHDTTLEEAYLDREMAEELAEAAKSELEAVKQKFEELQLEVDVLREENAELGAEISPEERTSQGWLQMERSNERLREALMRLRDMTQDTEAELREEIGSLEQDLKSLGGIREEYDEAKSKLAESEAAVESLKEQLDDALGSEQTIEEFATQNESLKEQIEELKIAIQDLEDLKELNDELEVNHVEAEKQMQDELDYKDSLISDHRSLAVDQQEKLVDYDYTITKFRELVTSLQNHLEDMKASQQISDAEAEELSSRSKAMTDLNLKLQSSASRTQMNAVDLELRRLEAQEAIEHLAIVQMFLPESYQSEKNSVMAYLRFIRLAAKSRILHQSLKSKLASDSNSIATDDAFALCDILDKLTWVATTCDRFVARISGSSLEDFAKYEAALHELDPVERGLNRYIESSKKDDLKGPTVAEELQRTEALLHHLAEVHITGDNLADFAEDVIMRTTLIQSHLENAASALAFTSAVAAPKGIKDLDEDDSIALFVSSSNGIIAQSRSSKVVAGKALQALQDLKSRSMSIGTEHLESFMEAQDACASLATLARTLGQHIRAAISAEEATEDNSLSNILRSALSSFCAKHIPDTTSSNPLSVFSTKLRSVASAINHLHDISSSLSSTLEFTRPTPPWSQRAAQLKVSKATSQSVEAELARLKDSLSAQSQTLRAKDTQIEEATVKIELLESRTKDANAKANRITDLSRALDAGKARERDLAAAIEGHARDLATLSAERDRWRGVAEERARSGVTDGEKGPKTEVQVGEVAVASAQEIAALNAQISGLQSAVRFLRNDNARVRLARPDEAHMAWLKTPLLTRRAAQQEPVAKARAASAKEARDALSQMTSIVLNARPLDLTSLSGGEGKANDRLRWRPAREKSSWIVAARREEWTAWKTRSSAAAQRGHDILAEKRPAQIRTPAHEPGQDMNGHAVPPSSEDVKREQTVDEGRTEIEAVA